MIIGLSGYARSGKDTVANYLVEKYEFTRMAFADPLREALYRLSPNIDIPGLTGVSLSWAVDKLGWERLKEDSPEVRELLQRMGTEVGRNMFGEDFWVNYAIEQAWSNTNVVFSDVRFHNEAYAIQKNWGDNWRINRAGGAPANGHISEVEMDSFKHFDHVIENDGDLDELYASIDLIMKEYALGQSNW